MTYFKNVQTLEQLRKQYKELLKKFHPDNANGSEKITKVINKEYEELFKVLKDKHDSNSDRADNDKTSYNNMKYNFEEDEKLREMIQKVIHFSDITIEICGCFIWISGNTYQYRKHLYKSGFTWAPKKKMWYWRPETYVKKGYKTLPMDTIRNKFGSTEIETDGRKRLATA